MDEFGPDVDRPARTGRPRDPSRDAALRAAIVQVLGEVGYTNLTIEAVATAAGAGKATIYRRWRTKSELVTAAVAELGSGLVHAPDTGSLEGDLRLQLRAPARSLSGSLGAATRALLSALPHEPELRAAFQGGPFDGASDAFDRVWARAVDRGELAAAIRDTAIPSTATAPLLARWLFSSGPLDDAFVDELLADVVLPLVAGYRPRG